MQLLDEHRVVLIATITGVTIEDVSDEELEEVLKQQPKKQQPKKQQPEQLQPRQPKLGSIGKFKNGKEEKENGV